MDNKTCRDCFYETVCVNYNTYDDNFDVAKHCPTFKDKKEIVYVKYGKWIETAMFNSDYEPIYNCSKCNKQVADGFIEVHKYCLHCGAKMDGTPKERGGEK